VKSLHVGIKRFDGHLKRKGVHKWAVIGGMVSGKENRYNLLKESTFLGVPSLSSQSRVSAVL